MKKIIVLLLIGMLFQVGCVAQSNGGNVKMSIDKSQYNDKQEQGQYNLVIEPKDKGGK